MRQSNCALVSVFLGFVCFCQFQAVAGDFPGPQPGQVPGAMHIPMEERTVIHVGVTDGDMSGTDNRVLQAAVDYVAGLGGGVVEIGPGEFLMRDSLHLRPNVTVRGVTGRTILRKASGVSAPLQLDGDYGEEQFTIAHDPGFKVGDGVAIWDRNSGGFHTTVARITGRSGSAFSISAPLNADCMVQNGAQAATVFPVVSGYYAEGAKVERLTIEGDKAHNAPLNGCRGAGIFLYRSHRAIITDCVVRNYNGDGISFQQSNDVTVQDCVSEQNAGLGLHPGSGSQRPIVRSCIARGNGEDGLFLCWRVKNGVFEENTLEDNGRFGISIGHKDTDNLLRKNKVIHNAQDGVFFREESEGMAGHRNRVEENLIENNGTKNPVAGIRVRGETRDLVLKDNIIRDSRSQAERKQTTGIRLEEKVGPVELDNNKVDALTTIEDRRAKKP